MFDTNISLGVYIRVIFCLLFVFGLSIRKSSRRVCVASLFSTNLFFFINFFFFFLFKKTSNLPSGELVDEYINKQRNAARIVKRYYGERINIFGPFSVHTN